MENGPWICRVLVPRNRQNGGSFHQIHPWILAVFYLKVSSEKRCEFRWKKRRIFVRIGLTGPERPPSPGLQSHVPRYPMGRRFRRFQGKKTFRVWVRGPFPLICTWFWCFFANFGTKQRSKMAVFSVRSQVFFGFFRFFRKVDVGELFPTVFSYPPKANFRGSSSNYPPSK